MTHLTRRHLLIASTALVPLAACQPGTTVQTVTAAMITDLGLIIGGITSKLPTLSSLGAGVANLVTDAQNMASQIKAGVAVNVGLPFMAKVQADLQSIMTTVSTAGSKVAADVVVIVQDAVTVANALAPLFGLLTVAAAAPGGRTLDQARANLAAAAK